MRPDENIVGRIEGTTATAKGRAGGIVAATVRVIGTAKAPAAVSSTPSPGGGGQYANTKRKGKGSGGGAGGAAGGQGQSLLGKVTNYKWRTGTKIDVVEVSTDKAYVEGVSVEEQPGGAVIGVVKATMDDGEEVELRVPDQVPPVVAAYLRDGDELLVRSLVEGERILSVTGPDTAVARVIECQPFLKTGQKNPTYKPATLDNGRSIKVPPHCETGEVVRIKLPEEEYSGRADPDELT